MPRSYDKISKLRTFFPKKWLFFFCAPSQEYDTSLGCHRNGGDAVCRIIHHKDRVFLSQTIVNKRVARMGMGGNEAVVQPYGKILSPKVVRDYELKDILTNTLLAIPEKVVAPEEKQQHHSKHAHEQYRCACKEGFIGILGFSHGAKVLQTYRKCKFFRKMFCSYINK